MRLLLVDEAIAYGGVERLWLALVPEIAQLVEEVIWLLPSHRIPMFAQAVSGVHRVRIVPFHPSSSRVRRLLHAVIRRLAGLPDWSRSQAILEWLEEERVREVIDSERITHVVYPALFRQQLPAVGVPVSASVMDTNYHPSWRTECEANLQVWAQRAQALVAISSFTLEEMYKICGERPKARLRAVPIAVERPKLDEKTAATCPAPHPRTLYFPGSFNPHKGHATLLSAVRLLHESGLEVRTLLTGGGLDSLLSEKALDLPELEAARSEFNSYPQAIRELLDVRGLVSPEEVEGCYQVASVVVLPSRYEGFGLPLSEAVGRRKRVLCSDIPAYREQVRLYGFDDAVTFVPTSSPAAWAEAIRQELENSRPFPYSSEDLSSLFSRRTWRDVAQEYVSLLRGGEL